MDMSTSLSEWGLVLFGIAGLGILFFLVTVISTLTGRSRGMHTRPSGSSAVARRSSLLVPFLLGGTLLSVGFVCVLLLWSVRTDMVQEGPGTATALSDSGSSRLVSEVQEGTNTPLPERQTNSSSEPEGTVAPESSTTDENVSTDAVPAWTTRKQTVLAPGEVPDILFVESSGLYSTKEEALAKATANAIRKFRIRLAETSETYKKLAVQPVPEDIFRTKVVQQVYTEKTIHTFGVYEEPMFRVHLQFLDSAAVREPVIEAWKSTSAGHQSLQYGVIFGILTALLGVVSAGLRAVSAAKGNRSRAVMTALAFAGAGAVVVLALA